MEVLPITVLWHNPDQIISNEDFSRIQSLLPEIKFLITNTIEAFKEHLEKQNSDYLLIVPESDFLKLVLHINTVPQDPILKIFVIDIEKLGVQTNDKDIQYSKITIVESLKELEEELLSLCYSVETELKQEQVKPEDISAHIPTKSHHEKPQHYHFENKMVPDFSLTKLLSFDTHSYNKDDVIHELISIVPGEGDEIRELFAQRSENLLQAICYSYSSFQIFYHFNAIMDLKEYSKVIKTITTTLTELSKQKERMIQEHKVLYRPVRGINPSDYEYDKRKGYWPSFTNTYLSLEKAQGYGKEYTIFIIHLSKNSPHPNILLSPGWAEYEIHEGEEVLLLPFFFFIVEKVEKRPDGFHYIHLSQSEEECLVSFDKQLIRSYWRDSLLKEFAKCLVIHSDRLYERSKSCFDLYTFLTSPEFRMLFSQTYEEATKDSLLTNPVVGSIAGAITFGITDVYTQKVVSEEVTAKLPQKIQEHLRWRVNILCTQLKKDYLNILAGEFHLDYQDDDSNSQALEEIKHEVDSIIDKILGFNLTSALANLGLTELSSTIVGYLISALTQGAVKSVLSKAFVVLSVGLSIYQNYTREEKLAQEITKAIQESKESIEESSRKLTEEFRLSLIKIEKLLCESMQKRILEATETP